MPTYQPNIPTGTVDLNIDYLNLQGNFQTLNTTYGIDHVPFANSTPAVNGFHGDIHFNPFSTVATSVTPNNYSTANQYPVQGTIPPGAPPTVAGIGQLFSAQVNDSINADTGLFWLSGNGNKVALTRNFVPVRNFNGYTFLPGGLILQWGVKTGITNTVPPVLNGPNKVTFPLTFPNAVFSITIAPVRVDNTNEVLSIYAALSTTSNFYFVTGSNNYNGAYWQAIGY
jgi:hypothetical protein